VVFLFLKVHRTAPQSGPKWRPCEPDELRFKKSCCYKILRNIASIQQTGSIIYSLLWKLKNRVALPNRVRSLCPRVTRFFSFWKHIELCQKVNLSLEATWTWWVEMSYRYRVFGNIASRQNVCDWNLKNPVAILNYDISGLCLPFLISPLSLYSYLGKGCNAMNT
jgi:hypothetical protein